jgi:hypothetical protein
MFGLFKRKEWQPEVVTEMKGAHDGLSVTVRDFPCLLDPNSGSRTYRTPNFGNDFIVGVTKELGDYSELRSLLAAGAEKTVIVNLVGLPSIRVSVIGLAPTSDRQLESDLADALIVALDSQGIKP